MSSMHFEMTVSVLPDDIDEQNHVNNTVYLRWVQEVATAHWRALASSQAQETIRWVVLRHEIDCNSAQRRWADTVESSNAVVPDRCTNWPARPRASGSARTVFHMT